MEDPKYICTDYLWLLLCPNKNRFWPNIRIDTVTVLGYESAIITTVARLSSRPPGRAVILAKRVTREPAPRATCLPLTPDL